MPEFLYIFGVETLRQRANNAKFHWEDQDSHGILIEAADRQSASAWGDHVAQRYVAELYGVPEVPWSEAGYASGIEDDTSDVERRDWPQIKVGEYPDVSEWLAVDRA